MFGRDTILIFKIYLGAPVLFGSPEQLCINTVKKGNDAGCPVRNLCQDINKKRHKC